MPLTSSKHVRLTSCAKVHKIYPTDQRSIGVNMASKEVVKLATRLLGMAEKHDMVRLTAFRSNMRITITAQER